MQSLEYCQTLPFEMITSIYSFLDIDTQICFHKIFGYYSFIATKIILNTNFIHLLNSTINSKVCHIAILKSIDNLFMPAPRIITHPQLSQF